MDERIKLFALRWIVWFLCFTGVALAADKDKFGIIVPHFEEIPKQREPKGEGVYWDILSYSVEKPFGDEHGRPTNAHETAHGIHATYRNIYQKALKKRVNAFYMLDGKIAVIQEPDFLVQHIAREIPQSLRGYRFQLYFVDQLRDWNDRPLYVFDEWTAYICGGETAVDDLEFNNIKADSDAVSGCLEFSLYAVAAYLTAKARVPDYLEHEPQFKSVLYYNLTRAEDAFYSGREAFPSSKQEKLYRALQSSPDAAPIRNCLRDEFGGAFLIEVAHEQSQMDGRERATNGVRVAKVLRNNQRRAP